MIRIAEKVGFMKMRAVMVCAKVGFSSSTYFEIRLFVCICKKTAS